jgi:hypothetical protein
VRTSLRLFVSNERILYRKCSIQHMYGLRKAGEGFLLQFDPNPGPWVTPWAILVNVSAGAR